MHRLKNRTLGIALGGAALGGLVFTGATSASAATLNGGGYVSGWSVRTRRCTPAPAAGAWPTRA